jgi:site-specific recombinase XerD
MNASHPWHIDALIQSYLQHQRRTRGLREPTLYTSERFIRLFIQISLGDDPIDPSRLAAADVVTFFASVRERFSPRSMKTIRTALRSLFRFLRLEGLCEESLEVAISTVAPAATSNSPSRGRVKVPQVRSAGRGMLTRCQSAWQLGRRLP